MKGENKVGLRSGDMLGLVISGSFGCILIGDLQFDCTRRMHFQIEKYPVNSSATHIQSQS